MENANLITKIYYRYKYHFKITYKCKSRVSTIVGYDLIIQNYNMDKRLQIVFRFIAIIII